MSIFLECPRVLKNAAKNEGRVGYITSGIQHRQLIKHSLLENENRLCYSTQSSTANFYPHERSWRRGNGGKMYAHGSVFFLFFFFAIWSHIFPLFFLSFPPFSFAFFCAFHMLGHLSRAWLLLTGCITCTKVQPNIFGSKIWPFFLTSEAFRALPLHTIELVFIPFLPRILLY